MEAILELPTQNQNETLVEQSLAAQHSGALTIESEAELVAARENLPYAELVSENLWQRLTSRIEKNEKVDSQQAQRIMNEALGFLKACGDNPNTALSPSETVDVGWHTFILYTKDYAEFCEVTAGDFIHHEPNDADQATEGSQAVRELMTAAETHDFLVAHDYMVDSELWAMSDNASQEAVSCTTPPPNPPPRPIPICGPGRPFPN